jgi:hypothetical protein
MTAIATPMSDNDNEQSNESSEHEGNEKVAKGTLRASWSIGAGGGGCLET